MNNIKDIEQYLIGNEKSFLKSNMSSAKITMISGKWGTGKTHFWENNIVPKLEKSIYISLFGKQKIADIENEILTKSLILSNALDIDSKSLQTISSFYSITKNIASLVSPKIADNIDNVKNNLSNKLSSKFIDENTIICYDDFERKSKHIDLNELFGFINQLTINSKCKTIIILNSEVFNEHDHNVFLEIKEKAIYKYLYFEPSIDELLNVLFDKKHFSNIMTHKIDIFEVFREINIINARSILQVLNNLKEWIDVNRKFSSEKWIKLLIYVNINYILNNHIFEARLERKIIENYNVEKGILDKTFSEEKINIYVKSYVINDLETRISDIFVSIDSYIKNKDNDFAYIIKNKLKSSSNQNTHLLDFVDENILVIKSWYFKEAYRIERFFDSHNTEEVNIFNNISSFIFTGICKKVVE